jgi:hypothetical protein
MSTLPQEFIDLAAELIGDEFAAFASDCVLKNSLGFNYSSQTEAEETQTVKMIRIDYQAGQYEQQSVMKSDYMLIGELSPITLDIRPDLTECTFASEELIIRKVEKYDQAAILLHVGRK